MICTFEKAGIAPSARLAVEVSSRRLTSLVVTPGIGTMVGARVGGGEAAVNAGVRVGGRVAVTNAGPGMEGVVGDESQPAQMSRKAMDEMSLSRVTR